MNFKIPKNDAKYHWTNHVIRKMAYYGLSPDRIKRVIRNPKRVEEGIAENTIAVMAEGTNKKKPTEIWVMYAKKQMAKGKSLTVKNAGHSLFAISPKLIVISAWRYPGISPVGKQIPIPADILEELKNEISLTSVGSMIY